MKSIYGFIIKPYKERYDNIRKINNKELIINTSIENHSFVSKKAVVVSTPIAYETNVKAGDVLYVHHNIFRRWYNQRGEEKNSSNFFKDDLYFCYPNQIYMHNLKAFGDYCFVKPIKNNSILSTDKERKHFGILKYSNKHLESAGVTPGELLTFTPDSEFEFVIEGERLYCMKSNDIAVTHEYEGNEEENNPSWAESN